MATRSVSKWDALEAYVASIQEALNVRHWEVTVTREASDVEAWADIDPHSQANTATLRVSHDFWEQKPERQREVLIHECLHLVTCRHDQVVENLEDALGKIAWATFEKQHDDAAERVVDHVARVIARWIPLPAFPSE